MADPVLFVTNTLGLYGETNGVATFYRSVLAECQRNNFPANVLTYGPEDRCEGNVLQHRSRIPIMVDSGLPIDLSLLVRSPSIPDKQYSVVWSATCDPLGRWARRFAAQQGIPFIASHHTNLPAYAERRYPKATLLGKALGSYVRSYCADSDAVVVPSDSAGERLRLPASVIAGGVDTDLFTPARRTWRDGTVRALYVGRVAPEKNLELLFDVFSESCLSDVELWIIGDGPSKAALERQHPKVTFTGALTGEKLANIYANCDFFVFPSETETDGLVVREAMSSGLPVVVMDAPGPKEHIIDGKTGYVASDRIGLRFLAMLLADDPERRNLIGNFARKAALQRTWTHVYEDVVSCIADARRTKAQ